MLPNSFINQEKSRVYDITRRQGVLSEDLFLGWEKTVQAHKNNSVKEANERLRNMVTRLTWGGFNLSCMDNEKICDYGNTRAARAMEFMPRFPDDCPLTNKDLCELEGRINLAGRLSEHGLELVMPESLENRLKVLRGAYVRICDPIWWRRKLKRRQKRVVEGVARDLGLVQKRKGGYCSNLALFNQRKQVDKNNKLLDSMIAENEAGESFYLSELQEKSISNPEIRRAELMTRIRGFEILAEKQNYVAAFWTITCPSKYHAFYASGGQNEKWQGDDVLDGQKYLVHLWAGFRAWLNRRGINGYGFRVSEPHHDGCPHWHILYFGGKAQLIEATQELEERCLREDGEETGADTNRFKVEWIKQGEDERGRKLSAAAYIAKYIAKSIDGFQVGKDKETGQDTTVSSERVVTWSRSWGIRQFQQIGGAPVGLWREMRRLKGEEKTKTDNDFIREAENEIFNLHETLESYEDQAEAWAVFNMMVGSGRDTLYKLWKSDEPETLHITQFLEIDHETGEVTGSISSNQVDGVKKRNQYGEVVTVVKGLLVDVLGSMQKVKTRFHEWSLKRCDVARERAVSLEGAQPLLL
jgi:hypothetical protein